jgi:hypothetical protein
VSVTLTNPSSTIVASAGDSQIVLTNSSSPVILSALNTSPSPAQDTNLKFYWSSVSAPTAVVISNQNTSQASFQSTMAGDYVFKVYVFVDAQPKGSGGTYTLLQVAGMAGDAERAEFEGEYPSQVSQTVVSYRAPAP